VSWLRGDVASELRRRAAVFSAKGWTKDEVAKWTTEVDSSIAAAVAKAEASKLEGKTAASFDLTSDAAWGSALDVTDPFIRAAIWAHWKAALRKWQEAQKK